MKKLFEKINMTPKLVINIVLIALLLLFIVQNVQSTQVKFLFFGFEIPLIIIIAISFFIGFLTAKVFSRKETHDKNVPEDRKE
jgi:uncharacterized integral membrane protein